MAKCKFIVLLIIIVSSVSISNSREEMVINPDYIYLNYESSLAYGSYLYFHQIADENYEIRWEFSGSNSYVGIILYAMTDLEFDKFQNLQTFYSYHLSDGSYYRDSGTFTPRSHDDWYIVFLNADSVMQTTYLTYDVDFIEDPSLLGMIVGTVIAFLVVGGIIGACTAIFNKNAKEKQRKQEVSQEIMPNFVQEQKELISKDIQNVKFCTFCGKTHRIDAVFCENCGRKF